jgi:hypothetical protein
VLESALRDRCPNDKQAILIPYGQSLEEYAVDDAEHRAAYAMSAKRALRIRRLLSGRGARDHVRIVGRCAEPPIAGSMHNE